MSKVIAGLSLFLAWLGLVSAQLVWIGHGIYELFTTDKGFFVVLLSNGGYWLLQMVVSFVFLLVAWVAADNIGKRK